jgi:hypothetical protein
MNIENLREGYREIMRRIYSPGPCYQRVRTFLCEYGAPKVAGSFNWRHLMAFAHATLRLGVQGRERLHYWRLLAWTAVRRPVHFQLAVTLAIYGHHFRKTCQALGV